MTEQNTTVIPMSPEEISALTGCSTRKKFEAQKTYFLSEKFQREIDRIRDKILHLEATLEQAPVDSVDQKNAERQLRIERNALLMREKVKNLFQSLEFPAKALIKSEGIHDQFHEKNLLNFQKKAADIEKKREEWREAAVRTKEFQRISEMSWEKLHSKRLEGHINPPLKGHFIEEIKVPVPHGFKLPPKIINQIKVLPPIEKGNETLITLPVGKEGLYTLPCPSGADVVAFGEEEGLAVASSYPLLWENADFVEEKAVYALKTSSEEKTFDAESFLPPPGEQAYWSKALPLPPEVKKQCEKNPHVAPEIISHFLHKRFIYVCHDELGKLFLEHADDLPLIMDELKMGHCDLLSWATCAYLRQLGIPALVVSERLTNKSGDAFLADFGHSRVAIMRPNETITFLDPTSFTSMPESYTPKHLKTETVRELSKQLANAEDDQEKREILRRFLENHQLTNEDIRQVPYTEYLNVPSPNSIQLPPFEEPCRETHEERIIATLPDISEATTDDKKFVMVENLVKNLSSRRDPEIISDVFDTGIAWSKVDKEITRRIVSLLKMLKTNYSQNEILSIEFCEEIGLYAKDLGHLRLEGYWDELRKTTTERELKKVLEGFEDDPDSYEHSLADYSIRQIGKLPHFVFTKKFIKEVKNHLQEPCDFIQKNFSLQRLFFSQLIIQAFQEPPTKEYLRKTFDMSEQDFQTLAKKILESGRGDIFNFNLGPLSKQRKKQVRSLAYWTQDQNFQKAKEESMRLNKIFEYAPEDISRFQNRIRNLLRSCDLKKKRHREEPEGMTSRPAVPGDDARKIDWKLYARSDKYNIRIPEMARAYSSPLHVHFEFEITSINLFEQVALIIDTLQQSIKKENREVWLSCNYKANYFRLSPRDNPFVLATLLLKVQRNDQGEFLHYSNVMTTEGTPKNMLAFGTHEGKLAALEYLMKKKCNIVTASLLSEELYIPCEVREKWVLQE